jgi:MoaA/NifB/PqqE/SkfB family radical SAM enzyme
MWTKRPLTVAFEITHSCTANCWHCNWGGPIKETRRTPQEYAAIAAALKPVVVNVSGGEPLARGDVCDIIRAIARPGRLPWLVVISNASQITPERFLDLKRAGMHQLSISIDFPDERHSTFRRIPGLFEHMDQVIPECTRIGEREDVSLNCCITAWNCKDLPDIVRLAKRWGVSVNFSAYTPLRMDDSSGSPNVVGKVAEVKRAIEDVIELKRQGYPVYSSEKVLWRYYDFLATGHAGGCRAGERFLVVNPDGRLTPCAMVMAYFDDQRAMLREFTRHNTCDRCYISTRGNSEKTAMDLLSDNVTTLIQLLPWKRSWVRAPASTVPSA